MGPHYSSKSLFSFPSAFLYALIFTSLIPQSLLVAQALDTPLSSSEVVEDVVVIETVEIVETVVEVVDVIGPLNQTTNNYNNTHTHRHHQGAHGSGHNHFNQPAPPAAPSSNPRFNLGLAPSPAPAPAPAPSSDSDPSSSPGSSPASSSDNPSSWSDPPPNDPSALAAHLPAPNGHGPYISTGYYPQSAPYPYSTMAAAAVVNSILALSSLTPALPQSATNGASDLGLLTTPAPPDFLSDNPLPNGFPWGTDTVDNTNPYTQAPNSGVTRNYQFNIARGFIAPDGVNRSALLINGAFPAPKIEVNWGDTISATVCNNIVGPEEGTALHWHGFLQKATPWYDGVSAVQQCPIAPGKCMTYTYTADLYGTSWYHSHYSAQYNAGLVGPVIVHGPKNVPYDIDVGPVLLTDWYHTDYFDIVKQVMETPGGPPPFSDNNLINGKMNYNCSLVTNGQACTPNAGLAKFKFTSGKKHRLRLINGGSEGLQRFTIDGHNMTVMANDFVPVQPYNTNVVTLGIGQRTDVIVTANHPSNSTFWMRADVSKTCSLANQPNALAAIYYEKADTTAVPTSTATAYDDSKCGNDPLSETTPFYPFPATSYPAVTQDVVITFGPNKTGNVLFYMNGKSFRANYDHPILLLANQGNTSYPQDPQWNVYNFGNNASVRLIVKNEFVASHPMHLHGHNFNVLAEGVGTWDGTITNQQNTQRRDVQLVQGGSATAPGYLVLQYQTDNPGVWPFHCHIAWHVSAGLYINTMEQTTALSKRVFPATVAQTCRDWAVYSGHDVVEEIDSGLKVRDLKPEW